MTHLRLLSVAKVTPAALLPLAILIWMKPLLDSPGSSQAIDDAVTTSLWWLAVALGVYLAGSIVMWAAFVGEQSKRTSMWLHRLTLPGSKRVAQVMLASAAMTISACSADSSAPVLRAVDTIAVDDGAPEDKIGEDVTAGTEQELPPPSSPPASTSSNPSTTEPLIEDQTTPLVEPPPLEVGLDPHPLVDIAVGKASSPTEHVVSTGESFWSIAEAHVVDHNADAAGADVAAYWRELVSANSDSLRSGEPNLIYVGETLTLPAIAAG